jgi:hypothetical protein
MACAVIRYRNINHSDIVFALNSEYNLPKDSINVKKIIIPDSYYLYAFYYGTNYRQKQKNLTELDNFIDQITEGREFIWYIPNVSYPIHKVIASHKKCLRYCFIEEGVFTYPDSAQIKHPLPPYNKRLMSLCNDNRLLFLDDYFFCTENKKYDCFFVSCESNAATVRNRIVLKDIFLKQQNTQFDNADAVLIFDNITRAIRGGVYSYQKALEYVIDTHFREKNYKKVLYRLRIRSKFKNVNTLILEALNKFPDITFENIDDSVIMENMIYTYDLPYYFLITSLGCYAGLFGRKSYSFSPIYEALEPDYRFFLKKYNIMNEGIKRFGVELLPALNKDGTSIPVVQDSLLRFIKREGIKFARKWCPLHFLALLQKLMPKY